MKSWIYIMGNKDGGVIYIGVTNDLLRRVQEHKSGRADGFTKRYRCHKLLYYEEFADISDAIAREKQLKAWRRAKKEQLIAAVNPEKRDLADNL